MNDDPAIEPTLDEKKAAVQQAIGNQIEAFRSIAKDMDENESRVAVAILILNTAQQFLMLRNQIAQIQQQLAQGPSLYAPDGSPIIQ